MYSKLNWLVGVAALTAISSPAFADHHDHENNHDGGGRHEEREQAHEHASGVQHEEAAAMHHEHAAAAHEAAKQAQFANWGEEREHYRKHWNNINNDRQAELDAQMRAAWLAYHHNHWNGSYSWNNYNDPQFLDYLHGSNPSLLNRLRGLIGI
jgi:hypothetical protein